MSSGIVIKILGCGDTPLDERNCKSSDSAVKIPGCNVTLLCENCDTPLKTVAI